MDGRITAYTLEIHPNLNEFGAVMLGGWYPKLTFSLAHLDPKMPPLAVKRDDAAPCSTCHRQSQQHGATSRQGRKLRQAIFSASQDDHPMLACVHSLRVCIGCVTLAAARPH
jgi:hypothetical protein